MVGKREVEEGKLWWRGGGGEMECTQGRWKKEVKVAWKGDRKKPKNYQKCLIIYLN